MVKLIAKKDLKKWKVTELRLVIDYFLTEGGPKLPDGNITRSKMNLKPLQELFLMTFKLGRSPNGRDGALLMKMSLTG